MKKWHWILVGAAVGGLAGFAYWYFRGCDGNHCAIWASPVNSTAYAALMGGLVAGIVKDKPSDKK